MANSRYGSIEWLAEYAVLVAATFQNGTLEDFQTWLETAKRASKVLDREATKRHINNDSPLITHAVRMQSVGKHLALLEQKYIPALVANRRDLVAHVKASQSAGLVDAWLKVIQHELEQAEPVAA